MDADALRQALEQAGIKHGLREETLLHALENREIPFIVAEGTAPLPAVDDSITFHIEERLLSGAVWEGLGDDLFRTNEVPFVEAGEPIVTHVPGTPGTDGMDVYGKVIKAQTPLAIQLRTVTGAAMSEDGKTVQAAISGRPRMEKEGKNLRFQVQPSYVHNGDLTIANGHLTFQGDITISGNVMEGLTVDGSGSVEVFGNVIGSKIQAGQHIHIRGNVIQSHLTAGAKQSYLTNLGRLLDEMFIDLSSLLDVIEQHQSLGQLQRLSFSQVATGVISLRFPRYGELLEQIQEIEVKIKTAPGKADAFDVAPVLPLLRPENWKSRSDLQAVLTRAMELRKELATLEGVGANVQLTYTLNTEVRAAGNILVRGQGCIHSVLEAGETLAVHGKLLGGKGVAKGNIYVRETGSMAGARTALEVDAKGRIDVDTAHENTVFTIGKNVYKVADMQKRVTAVLDHDARIALVPRR